LSEFRSRLIEGGTERLLLDTLLQRLRDHGLVKAKGRQRTESTHVLAAVSGLNRLERVGETARAALNEFAVVAPDWLQALAPSVRYERYSRRVEAYRLPKAEKERLELAAAVGADVDQLWLRSTPQSSSRDSRNCLPFTFSARSGQRNTSKTGSSVGAQSKRGPQPLSKSHLLRPGGSLWQKSVSSRHVTPKNRT
jgi:hypothetical protein